MDEKRALALAKKAIEQGNKAAGRRFLLQAIRANVRSETAWLWLSAIVDDPTKERECLERVVKINPDNEIARHHLAKLDRVRPSPESAPQPSKVPRQEPFVLPDSPPKKSKKKPNVMIWFMLLCILIGVLCCVVAYVVGNLSMENEKEYYVEYTEAKAGRVAALDVVFSVRVTPERAEEILRLEWKRYMKRKAPTGDVLVTAWYSSTGDYRDEEPIPLTDGSSRLVYRQNTKELMTWKEFMQATTPRSPSEVLDVSFDIELRLDQKGRARVEGTTNLPSGMSLMITIGGKINQYQAQDQIIVKNGKFSSEWFSDYRQPGNKLLPGTYSIRITSPLAELQPKEVQNVIGNRGERMGGSFVRLGEYGNRVDFSEDFVIP